MVRLRLGASALLGLEIGWLKKRPSTEAVSCMSVFRSGLGEGRRGG